MDWTAEAEAALKKVPFFVRKRVRTRVENEARCAGKNNISLSDVRRTQKRYLASMSDEVQGYQLVTCFGGGGCPNRAIDSDMLVERLEETLKNANILDFLKERVRGALRHHHEFRVASADCPKACSQPQIKDMGIVGAAVPMVTTEPCTSCLLCGDACAEEAVTVGGFEDRPLIDYDRCVRCGRCVSVCPTGTIATGPKGYRIMLGGKLGRHPRLAQELPGTYREDQVIKILERCLDFYKNHSKHGERFSEIYDDVKIHGLFTPADAEDQGKAKNKGQQKGERRIDNLSKIL